MEQLELNMEMIERGKASYMKDFHKKVSKGRLSETKEGTRLMSTTIDKVINAIDEFKKEQSNRRASNQASTYMAIKNISSKVLAFIAVRNSLDSVSQTTSVTGIYRAIGQEVLDEERFTYYKKHYKDDWDMALKYSKKAGTSHRRTFLTLCLNKREDIERWPSEKIISVGALLFEIVNNTLGFFDVIPFKVAKNKTTKKVLIREELLKWIKDLSDHNASLNTEYMPMLEQPIDWKNDKMGGYEDVIPNYSFISKRSQKHSSESLSTAPDSVLNAINLAQRTAWKINKNVLDKVNFCLNNDIVVGKKMGSAVLIEEPEKPEDIETNIEARKEYRRLKAEIIQSNIKNTSQRYNILRTVNLANKFSGVNKIYFPYCIDFRGRLYPKSLYLHPQGSDMVKALLTFSDGEKVESKDQADWLAIHGANCYGLDKKPYEERVKWVEDNKENIIGVTEGSDFWMEADKPWLFLAFCYEWAKFQEQGYGFITTLPVSIDGSNNGLQLLSLMMRDPDGAGATNVLDVETPNDIYQDIADDVNSHIIKDFDTLDQSIKNVLNILNISRSAVKKQTMTLAYSATYFSCRDYTKLWLLDQLEDLNIKLTPIELKTLVRYVATLVWQAINNRLLKAKDLMQWFKDAGKTLLDNGHEVEWYTPLGLHIEQDYRNCSASRIDLNIGRRLTVLNYKKLDTPNISKNLFAISPNIVHSLDAAALQLTLNYGEKYGIKNFLCVHDSFGTLCTKMTELAACVRTAYHTLFTNDIPAQLKSYWETKTGLELPELPEYGTMNIDEILNADYFFC